MWPRYRLESWKTGRLEDWKIGLTSNFPTFWSSNLSIIGVLEWLRLDDYMIAITAPDLPPADNLPAMRGSWSA
jgi:hypothetical protein